MAENGTISLLNRFAVVAGTAAASLGFIAPAALAEIDVDGSSTVFPITEAIAEDFIAGGGAQVVVNVSGTGGGFKKFCAEGGTDISNASRPIKPSEMQACADAGVEYIEIPVAYDALTVVANPENALVDNLTIDQLARLWDAQFEGEATTWSDLGISGPGADAEITLYGPGADSGTFDYFVEEAIGDAGDTRGSITSSGDSRGDYTASEDDNVLVVGVASDVNALGYFGLAYYAENSEVLKAVNINGVTPTSENVEALQYTPFSRPIFIYVNKDSYESDADVAAFVDYYLDNAAAASTEVGYVALPASDYATGASLIAGGEVGTVFRRNDPDALNGLTLSEQLDLSRTLDAPAE